MNLSDVTVGPMGQSVELLYIDTVFVNWKNIYVTNNRND